MKIIRHLDTIPDDVRGSVVVLGNFDGFHKGHQKVIGTAGRIAHEMGTTLSVLSMEPHPRLFFNPTQKEFRLNSFKTKAHLLEEFGVDHFVVLPFDKEFDDKFLTISPQISLNSDIMIINDNNTYKETDLFISKTITIDLFNFAIIILKSKIQLTNLIIYLDQICNTNKLYYNNLKKQIEHYNNIKY